MREKEKEREELCGTTLARRSEEKLSLSLQNRNYGRTEGEIDLRRLPRIRSWPGFHAYFSPTLSNPEHARNGEGQ